MESSPQTTRVDLFKIPMCMHAKSLQLCLTLWDPMDPARLLCPWNSPGKSTGVSSLSLLQGILPTQGSNPGLPHCRWILCQLSHKGSPKILSHSVMSDSLQPQGLYSPWNSPGQNTGVGSLSLLQGIFPTQGSNPGLPHCRRFFTS